MVKKQLRPRNNNPTSMQAQNQKLGYVYNSELVDEVMTAMESRQDSDLNVHGAGGQFPKLSATEKAQVQKTPEKDKDSDEHYIVEKIIQKKRIGKKTLYLVQWEGFGESDATWEPLNNLKNIKDMVKEFDSKVAKEQQLMTKVVQDFQDNSFSGNITNNLTNVTTGLSAEPNEECESKSSLSTHSKKIQKTKKSQQSLINNGAHESPFHQYQSESPLKIDQSPSSHQAKSTHSAQPFPADSMTVDAPAQIQPISSTLISPNVDLNDPLTKEFMEMQRMMKEQQEMLMRQQEKLMQDFKEKQEKVRIEREREEERKRKQAEAEEAAAAKKVQEEIERQKVKQLEKERLEKERVLQEEKEKAKKALEEQIELERKNQEKLEFEKQQEKIKIDEQQRLQEQQTLQLHFQQKKLEDEKQKLLLIEEENNKQINKFAVKQQQVQEVSNVVDGSNSNQNGQTNAQNSNIILEVKPESQPEPLQAQGSFEQGDTPVKVINAKVSANQQVPSVLVTIEWKVRHDGVKPLNSTVMNTEARLKCPMLLVDFYETRINFRGAPSKK